MKKILFLFVLAIVFQFPQAQDSNQDEPTVPGDQFSLHGALDLFKKASSPEEFEKLLNEENNKVNNLDLNEDGDIDYIRVEDKSESDVHAFVLQAVISENEYQDIAVIELEKESDDKAIIQIIGDADIYGEETIVEPFEEELKGGKGGPNAYTTTEYIVVNVWGWPCVRFVYGPVYRPWISPWRWRAYPHWWRPWRPLGWAVWHPHVRIFRPGFHACTTHRVVRAHRAYHPHRVSSVTVTKRHSASIGKYRSTKTTKTTVTKHTAGGKHVKATKTTKTTKGPRGGTVKTTKTKVKRR